MPVEPVLGGVPAIVTRQTAQGGINQPRLQLLYCLPKHFIPVPLVVAGVLVHERQQRGRKTDGDSAGAWHGFSLTPDQNRLEERRGRNVRQYCVVISVIPLTTDLGRVYPFQLLLPHQRTCLDEDSKAQVEQLRSVALSRVLRRLGFVPHDLMVQLSARVREHLALN